MPPDEYIPLTPVNRSVITIVVKKPFQDWLESLPEKSASEHFNLDNVNEDNSAYMVPAFEDQEQPMDYVKEIAPAIFEEQLESWYTDETNWPKNRDWKTFQEWFDVRIHTMAFDFCDEPLERE